MAAAGGGEELGAELQEEGTCDGAEDEVMEGAEAGLSVGSPGAPGREEQGGAGGRAPGAVAAAVGV